MAHGANTLPIDFGACGVVQCTHLETTGMRLHRDAVRLKGGLSAICATGLAISSLAAGMSSMSATAYFDTHETPLGRAVGGDGAVRQIAVTPAGGVWDAKDGDKAWNTGAKVRPTIEHGRWLLEMEFPYEALGGAPKSGDRWKFTIVRNSSAKDFASCGWPVCAHRDFASAATLSFK